MKIREVLLFFLSVCMRHKPSALGTYKVRLSLWQSWSFVRGLDNMASDCCPFTGPFLVLSPIPDPSRNECLMDVVSTHVVFPVMKSRLERAAAHAQLLKVLSQEYFYFFFLWHECNWNHDAADKFVLPAGKQSLQLWSLSCFNVAGSLVSSSTNEFNSTDKLVWVSLQHVDPVTVVHQLLSHFTLLLMVLLHFYRVAVYNI